MGICFPQLHCALTELNMLYMIREDIIEMTTIIKLYRAVEMSVMININGTWAFT